MSYNDTTTKSDEKHSYSYIAIAASKNNPEKTDNCPTEIRGSTGSPRLLRVYVPLHYEIIVEKAKKIVRREGRSLSDLIRDLLRDYVRLHEPGNPQLPIDRFFNLEPEKDPLPPEDLKLIRMVTEHLEAGYDLNSAAVEHHRRLALKYRDRSSEAMRLLELLNNLEDG